MLTSSRSIASIPPYTGPGDVITGALGWWGLRAYSRGAIGLNAVRLRRSSDNAELDFTTGPNGALSSGAIIAWQNAAGAANAFVRTLYDQTGGGQHMVQTTAGNQPQLVFGKSPNFSAPTMFFNNGPSIAVPGTFPTSTTTPFSVATVSFDITPPSTFGTVFGAINQNTGVYYLAAGNTLQAYPLPSQAISDGVWHDISVYWDVNGPPDSVVAIDGTLTAGLTVGITAGYGPGPIMGNDAGSEALIGYVSEAGLWLGDRSSLFTAIGTNQGKFYGYR